MAVGDVKSAYSNDLADNGTLDIKPTGTEEWVIHNIYAEGEAELYWNDGTHSFLFATITGGGWLNGLFSHVTATYYMTLKNIAGSAKDFGYDGVLTKV